MHDYILRLFSSALFNAANFPFEQYSMVLADLRDQLTTLRQEHERVIGQKRQLERELGALDPVCSVRVNS